MGSERLPGTLLRLEGAALFAAAIALYVDQGFSALAFVLLILAPDVSLLGYLANERQSQDDTRDWIMTWLDTWCPVDPELVKRVMAKVKGK